MPNKYCLQSKYKAGFGVIFWDKKSVTVMIPIYIILLYFMLKWTLSAMTSHDYLITKMAWDFVQRAIGEISVMLITSHMTRVPTLDYSL